MNFEMLARKDPLIMNSTAHVFWEGIDRGELSLPRCSLCGKWQWYPTAVGCCRGGELVWAALPGTGTIFTCTRVHFNFLPEVTGATPFNVGLIELDNAEGVRLVGILAIEEPSIGGCVRVDFVERTSGKFPIFVAIEN
jgi:uncharacterized OB-fold protein